jgi:hypothetical protein
MNNAFKIILTLALFASNFSYAESQRQMCEGSGNIAKKWAEARDSGMPFTKLTSNIDKIGQNGGMSEEDILRAKSMAVLVYSDLKSYSPDRTWKYFYSNCMKG